MSTSQTPTRVHAPVLGEEPVEARVIDTLLETNITTGPRRILRLDVDGFTFRVPEEDCTPI